MQRPIIIFITTLTIIQAPLLVYARGAPPLGPDLYEMSTSSTTTTSFIVLLPLNILGGLYLTRHKMRQKKKAHQIDDYIHINQIKILDSLALGLPEPLIDMGRLAGVKQTQLACYRHKPRVYRKTLNRLVQQPRSYQRGQAVYDVLHSKQCVNTPTSSR